MIWATTVLSLLHAWALHSLWITRYIESTYRWFGRYRRLNNHNQKTSESNEDLIYAAMISRMLHLLQPV